MDTQRKMNQLIHICRQDDIIYEISKIPPENF